MNRRRFLLSGGAAGLLGLAGCTGLDGGDGGTDPTDSPTDAGASGSTPERAGQESLPEAVYIQRYLESMAMQGTAQSGEYAASVMYSAPHLFWNMSGASRSETPIEDGDSVHLMAVVWDPETNTVLPEVGVSVEIVQDGDLVSQEVIYPMLSQRMGFHWGGNFGLDGDGEYTARVNVGGMNVRRSGAFEGRFDDPATIEIPFAFNEAERSKVTVEELDQYGQRGAVNPMEMGMMPEANAPAGADLPGEVLAETTSGDAVFVSTRLSGATAGRFDASNYLAVSARTPYNGTVLPSMAVEATVTRDGETVLDGALTRGLDPELGYHYGTAIEGGLSAGDEVELRVPTPPQVARHEGYERAFIDMPPMRFTV